MNGLTEGRMVHFVMPNGVHRPAVVVQVWSKDTGTSNLQVFIDGRNDSPDYYQSGGEGLVVHNGTRWETSIIYSEEKIPGTWHWIERA